jgi:AcrR family transcriptional regulator
VSENGGCTKGALHDHFGSKEGLFMALLDDQFAARIAQAEQAADQPPSEAEAMPFDRDFALSVPRVRMRSWPQRQARPNSPRGSPSSDPSPPIGSATRRSPRRWAPPPTGPASKR